MENIKCLIDDMFVFLHVSAVGVEMPILSAY